MSGNSKVLKVPPKRLFVALVALFLFIAPNLLSVARVFAQESNTPNNPQPYNQDGLFPIKVNGATSSTGGNQSGPTPYSGGQPYENGNGNLVNNNGVPDTSTYGTMQPSSRQIPTTTPVQQFAEQGLSLGPVMNDLARGDGYILPNQFSDALHLFYGHDIIGDLFRNIGSIIAKWLSQLLDYFIVPTIQWLSKVLSSFVLNTNIAIGGLKGEHDDISPAIRHLADLMYSVAVDLLLLMFILCIWKYWAEAQWRGMVNILSPVLRLITTSAILMCWPTIYGFVIQISNEMVQAIWFNGPGEIQQLNNAIATSLSSAFVAGSAGILQYFAPTLFKAAEAVAGVDGPIAGGLLLIGGKVVAFGALILWTVLGGIIVVELICLIVLKAIQQILLIAQYVFAPIFIVFFAAPDTESFTVKYMYGFVITNLWSFFWVGSLRILVIILNSNYEFWGKPLLLLGALTLMIMAPAFMMGGIIEPKSPFLDPGSIFRSLTNGMELAGGALSQGLRSMFSTEPASVTGGTAQGPDHGGKAFSFATGGNSTGSTALNNTATSSTKTAPPPVKTQTGQTTSGAVPIPLTTAQGASTNLGFDPNDPNAVAGLDPTLATAQATSGGDAPPPANPSQDLWPKRNDAKKLADSRVGAGKAGLQRLVTNAASFIWSTDGSSGPGRNAAGDVDRIYASENSTPEERARIVMHAGLASDTSDEGKDASRRAAIQTGLSRPKTIAERFNYLDALDQGNDWSSQTPMGKARMAIAMGQAADQGSHAFMKGESGNAYTELLRKQFRGNLNPTDTENISSLITDPSLATSPFNDKAKAVGDKLSKHGIYPGTSATACMMNSFVGSLNGSDQMAVVPVMEQLINQEVDGISGASSFTYQQRVRAVTQMAAGKGKDFVEEILQINKVSPHHISTSRGSEVVVGNNASINANSGLTMLKTIMSSGNLDAATAAKSLHQAVQVQGVDLRSATAAQLQNAAAIVQRAQSHNLNTSQLVDPIQLAKYLNP